MGNLIADQLNPFLQEWHPIRYESLIILDNWRKWVLTLEAQMHTSPKYLCLHSLANVQICTTLAILPEQPIGIWASLQIPSLHCRPKWGYNRNAFTLQEALKDPPQLLEVHCRIKKEFGQSVLAVVNLKGFAATALFFPLSPFFFSLLNARRLLSKSGGTSLLGGGH